MDFSYLTETTLPLTNPVTKFLVILIIILFAPIILNRFKIPHILGLIIAGAIIGPHGFNLLTRDSSIILSGTAGLLYIMFLAGLQLDLEEFRKNRIKSLIFGMYTFLVPMILGFITSVYLLKFSMLTSILLASMYASHTLIAYPLLSKLGIVKNRAVIITVGGTLITDTLALLVLAVIIGMTTGIVNAGFWVQLSVSVIVFGSIILVLFPIIGRWFLKRFDDNISQYIFVLVMVFLGAVLAEAAGIEGIIGAFLTGISLNRMIPSTSPLMNRIDFVGNAVFIPFFLIGVGMLIDYHAFFNDVDTLKVAAVMTAVATLSKFIAAWLTQKSFAYTVDERRIIFGLSNAQATATLAAVMIGYNVILGISDSGEPIRLLNDSILNGTIVMILITCTIASFAAQKGGINLTLSEVAQINKSVDQHDERILISLSNPHTVEELVNFSMIIKSGDNKKGIYALNIIDNDKSVSDKDVTSRRLLDKAVMTASATDSHLNRIIRYDANIVNGITGVIKENSITDLVLGLHVKKEISESFLGELSEGILAKCNITTFVYKPAQPIATIRRHVIVIPRNSEKEIGFPYWLSKIWNIPKNTGTRIIFYSNDKINAIIQELLSNYPLNADFKQFDDWNDFQVISGEIRQDDNLILVLSRENRPSFHENMIKVPALLNTYFRSNSFILIYPMQLYPTFIGSSDRNNPSLLEPIEKLDEIINNISNIFRRK